MSYGPQKAPKKGPFFGMRSGRDQLTRRRLAALDAITESGEAEAPLPREPVSDGEGHDAPS